MSKVDVDGILSQKEERKKQESFSEVPESSQDWKSSEINKLAEALAKAQSELEGAKKESVNPFFKSSYADLHAVIKSAFPYLSKYGLSVSQGNEVVTAQGVGAAITYGRRYGLSAIAGIAQYDDDANSIRK